MRNISRTLDRSLSRNFGIIVRKFGNWYKIVVTAKYFSKDTI